MSMHRGDEVGVVEDPAQRAGHRDEAAGRQLDADGVAHHVLEHVGLVEHDDVVLGQDHAAAADVEAVEVGVDDDDVGGLGSAPGLLGEARLAERAAVGARALVAADAHHPPHRVGRRPVELGAVAGVGACRPTWRCGRSRRGRVAVIPSSSSWPAASSCISRSRCRQT